jgi:hypothetical protein
VSDRVAFNAIVFVLVTRIAWSLTAAIHALHFFRRRRIRWQRRPRLHEAFMHLGCAVICQRYLRDVRLEAARLKGG